MFNFQRFNLRKLNISYGLGLDISDSILRLMRLKKTGDEISLENYESIVVPSGYIVQGELKRPKEVAKLVSSMVRKISSRFTPLEIVISLPETKTFLKMIRIANISGTVSKTKASERVKEDEVFQYLPVAKDDVYIDYQAIAYEVEYTSWLVAACPKRIVDSYIQLTKDVNILPIVLEVEALAIIRSIMADIQGADSAVLIVDLGMTRTGMILHDYSSIQFTASVPLSGLEITKKISSELGIDYQEAEEVKLVCGLDNIKCQGVLRNIMIDHTNALIDGIKRTIYFYQKHFLHGRTVSKVVLTGGGASCLRLVDIIKETINIDTVLANPMLHIDYTSKNIKFSTKAEALSLATVIGLAMRALEDV